MKIQAKRHKVSSKTDPPWIIWVLLLVIFLIWIGYGAVLSWWMYPEANHGEHAIEGAVDPVTRRGLSGDMFGGFNALFAALAFAALAYSIRLQQQQLNLQRGDLRNQTLQLRLQRRELALQRKELELTRKELERAANAQTASEKTLQSELELLKLNSKLPALMAALESDIRHIKGKHKSLYHQDDDPAAYNITNFERWLIKIEESLQQNPNLEGGRCCAENIRDIIKIKKSIHDVLAKLT